MNGSLYWSGPRGWYELWLYVWCWRAPEYPRDEVGGVGGWGGRMEILREVSSSFPLSSL